METTAKNWHLAPTPAHDTTQLVTGVACRVLFQLLLRPPGSRGWTGVWRTRCWERMPLFWMTPPGKVGYSSTTDVSRDACSQLVEI